MKLFFTLIFLLTISCTSLVKPDTKVKIKDIAIISYYVNKYLYDVDSYDFKSINLSLGESVAFKNINPLNEVIVDKIVNQSFPKLLQEWNNNKNEKFLPLKEYVFNPIYLNFLKKKQAAKFDFEGDENVKNFFFIAPKRIKVIPLQQIVSKKENQEFEVITSVFDYQDLANLATHLKVDAVFIIKHDLAYSKTSSGQYHSQVGFQVLMVNREAEVVVQTEPLGRSTGIWFKGDKIKLDKNKYLIDDDANLVAILKAFDKGFEFLIENINFD